MEIEIDIEMEMEMANRPDDILWAYQGLFYRPPSFTPAPSAVMTHLHVSRDGA